MSPRPEIDWPDVLPRLLLWAQSLHRRYLAGLPGAPTPEDLVQDAAADLLTGRRVWPDGLPAFVVLHGIVRSLVSNAVSRASVPGAAGFVARCASIEEAGMADGTPADESVDRSQVRARALRLVSDDDVLSRVVALWFDDPSLKPLDVAAMLGLAPADVYHATKRLRRRLEPLGPLLRTLVGEGDPPVDRPVRLYLIQPSVPTTSSNPPKPASGLS